MNQYSVVYVKFEHDASTEVHSWTHRNMRAVTINKRRNSNIKNADAQKRVFYTALQDRIKSVNDEDDRLAIWTSIMAPFTMTNWRCLYAIFYVKLLTFFVLNFQWNVTQAKCFVYQNRHTGIVIGSRKMLTQFLLDIFFCTHNNHNKYDDDDDSRVFWFDQQSSFLILLSQSSLCRMRKVNAIANEVCLRDIT